MGVIHRGGVFSSRMPTEQQICSAALHDGLEHEVILNREVFPRLEDKCHVEIVVSCNRKRNCTVYERWAEKKKTNCNSPFHFEWLLRENRRQGQLTYVKRPYITKKI